MDFDDLPDSWCSINLGEIICVKNGYAFKSSDYSKEGIYLIRISDIQDEKVIFDNAVMIPVDKSNNDFLIENGDLLIAMSGATTGKTGIYKGTQPCLQNQRVGNLKIKDKKILDQNFRNILIYYLRQEIEEQAYGGAQPNISPSKLENIVIPLPPLNEQKRIVEKIELIQEHTRKVKSELDNIKVKLKRLRRSLLASAFRGDLTKDWRADHPDIESATVLLERIKKERREKWEQAELEKMRVKGITPKDDKWKSKYSEPQSVKNIDDLPNIPDGWCWGTVEQFADVGTGATPLKKNNKYYDNGNIPWVTSGSLNDLFITNPDNYITPLALKETNTKIFPKHTLLIAMYGEGKTRGKVSELLIEAATNQACAAILMEGIAIQIRYIVKLFFLKNYDDLRKLAAGGVQPNLNLTMIKLTAVPLPPLEEQKEIVRKLEKMMQFADRVEERVKEAEKKLDKFNQSVLAKAFRGKLVPQDPNDEPASVLLGKIQQEKNSTTSKKIKK